MDMARYGSAKVEGILLAISSRLLETKPDSVPLQGTARWLARILQPKASFEEAVRAEIPTLYRVARRLLPTSPEEAEDAVGQTLLKAFRSEAQFNGEHLRSWLITILRNELFNRRRYQSIRPTEVELDIEQGEDRLWSEVACRMDHEAILVELDGLDEDFRLAIQLCDIEGMSYEEVAEAMSIPIGTVRSRLFRGRAKLRDRLADRVLVREDLR